MSPASLLYPYGLEHGDQVLPAEDDDFSEELRLLDPFMLFEAIHRTAYVSALALTVQSLGSLSSPHLTLNSEPVYIYSSWLLLASSSVLLGRALSLFCPLPCQHPPAGLVLPHFPQFCTKGLVSLGEPVALFTLEAFPPETGQDFAVPFWADGSMLSRGWVWHQRSCQPELPQQAAQDLASALPHAPPTSCALLVATWDQIPFYGALGPQVRKQVAEKGPG